MCVRVYTRSIASAINLTAAATTVDIQHENGAYAKERIASARTTTLFVAALASKFTRTTFALSFTRVSRRTHFFLGHTSCFTSRSRESFFSTRRPSVVREHEKRLLGNAPRSRISRLTSHRYIKLVPRNGSDAVSRFDR